jgi:hypothetical protein
MVTKLYSLPFWLTVILSVSVGVPLLILVVKSAASWQQARDRSYGTLRQSVACLAFLSVGVPACLGLYWAGSQLLDASMAMRDDVGASSWIAGALSVGGWLLWLISGVNAGETIRVVKDILRADTNPEPEMRP